jgi:protein SCO1/2
MADDCIACFKRIVSSCAVLVLLVMLTGCVSSPRPTSACCATNLAPAVPFTDQSLYQLDSKWTNDFGHPLQLGAWRGRVQVVAMFFASCTYACPIIVHDLQRIEAALTERLRTNVSFALITIDTERDTPDTLHAYRATRKLPADRWTLLRGAPDDTLELAALLGVKFKREASGQFAHSNLITVLNEQGEVIHQLPGLNQDISETVKRISAAVTK